MVIRTKYVAGRCWVYAQLGGPPRVVIVNERARLHAIIQLPEGAAEAIDFSADGKLMATGYYGTRGLDIWGIRLQSRLSHINVGFVTRLRFDPLGEGVVYSTRSGSFIRNLNSNACHKVRYLGDLRGAALDSEAGLLWMPGTKRGEILRLDWRTGVLTYDSTPCSGIIWCISLHPIHARRILIDSDGNIVCCSKNNWSVFWRQALENHELSSTGTFSADGKFFTAYCTEAKYAIVLDTMTGERTRQIDARVGTCTPFSASEVLASNGSIVDLATGEINEGLSDWRWWRDLGA